MNRADNILLSIVEGLILIVLGIIGLYYFNMTLVNEDIRKFRERKNLAVTDTFYIFDDYAEILGRKFPPGTHRSQTLKEFSDCDGRDSIAMFTNGLEDGFAESYYYKLGFWGRLELGANYDTSGFRKENEFACYFQYDPYDL